MWHLPLHIYSVDTWPKGQTSCVFPSRGTKRTNTLCLIPQSWDKSDKHIVCNSLVVGQNGQTRCVWVSSRMTKPTNTLYVCYSAVVWQNGQTCVIPPQVMGQNGQTRCVRFPSPGTKRTNTLNVFYSPVVGQNGQKSCVWFLSCGTKWTNKAVWFFRFAPCTYPRVKRSTSAAPNRAVRTSRVTSRCVYIPGPCVPL